VLVNWFVEKARINTKNRILFIVQLPPPVHGVSIMNSYVINSKVIGCSFIMEVINLQFAKSIKEVAKFSMLKIYKTFFCGLLIVKTILTKKPDLVYFTIAPTGFAFYRDALYVFLLKLFNSKIVFHLHGKGIKDTSKKNLINKKLCEWVFHNTHVICLSNRLTSDIKDIYKGIPFIVPNGIKLQLPFYKKVYSENQTSKILFFSNYIQSKGILILIKALGILGNKGFDFTARIVGEPGDLSVEILESYISKEGLSKTIIVTGPKYGNEKLAEFCNADIFVFPTYFDAFPLVCLEAMQFSLPIISTYEGGIPDILNDNITGFLVEPQNAQILADKIAILLRDRDLRIEMGKKSFQQFINNYTLSLFENNMMRTFNAILGTKKDLE
jgi:glycosyltransferase involved in cell wall biosynthesis